MADYVAFTKPHDGVALVTVTDPGRQNNLCWQAVDELADALVRARTEGARVSVVASGVEGHWLEHAWLTDLADTFEGKPPTGDGGASSAER